MHEGTHAGMGLEQANMTQSQSEYGAFCWAISTKYLL